MGENYMNEPRFFIKMRDGEEYEVDIRCIEIDEPNMSPTSIDNPLLYNNLPSLRVTLQPPVVSRKRIMKLLMARGIQRNGASEIANFICRRYGFYNPLALLTIL